MMSHIEKTQKEILTSKVEELAKTIQGWIRNDKDARIRITLDVKKGGYKVEYQEFDVLVHSDYEDMSVPFDHKDLTDSMIEFPEQKVSQTIETPEMHTGFPSSSTQRMVTIREAAAATGLSYYSIRNMCLTNKIAHVRAGTKILINLDRLIDLLNGEA